MREKDERKGWEERIGEKQEMGDRMGDRMGVKNRRKGWEGKYRRRELEERMGRKA
jgi:hypothetical protein